MKAQQQPEDTTTARIGACYRHFKGGFYTVRAIANHSETGEQFVIYSGIDGVAWARPREMFEDGRYQRVLDMREEKL